MSLNRVFIMGNLGQDPELRYTPSQTPVVTMSVATTDVRTVDGQKQEQTEWHRVVVWGKLAEICGKHLSKGRQVYVEGRLQTRQWEDQQGQKKYTTEIVANTVQFLGSAGGERSADNNRNSGGGDDFGYQDFGPEPSFNSSDDIPF